MAEVWECRGQLFEVVLVDRTVDVMLPEGDMKLMYTVSRLEAVLVRSKTFDFVFCVKDTLVKFKYFTF